MKIPLTKGLFAEIDDVDVELVSKYTWCANKCGKRIYATTYTGGGRKNAKYIRMHVLLMGTNRHQRVDHINENGLDNRRENLRIATHAQNLVYSWSGPRGVSGFKGVTTQNGRFRARGSNIELGIYLTAIEAAEAYDSFMVNKFGEFAVTNKMLGLL